MNDFSKILITSKLSSMTGAEAIVDLITEKGIYIGFRGQSLKQFDRLYFTKEQVNDFFNKSVWTLIDGRTQTSLKEIRESYNTLFIIGIDKEIDIDAVINENKKNTILYNKNNGGIRKFLGVETVDGEKFIYITPLLSDFSSPTESSVRLYYKYSDIKDELCATSSNRKTLDEIAVQQFKVKDASFLHIKDM